MDLFLLSLSFLLTSAYNHCNKLKKRVVDSTPLPLPPTGIFETQKAPGMMFVFLKEKNISMYFSRIKIKHFVYFLRIICLCILNYFVHIKMLQPKSFLYSSKKQIILFLKGYLIVRNVGGHIFNTPEIYAEKSTLGGSLQPQISITKKTI